MAKYEITHACGHVETHSIIGPSRNRTSRIEYLSNTLCGLCYAADAANRKAAEKDRLTRLAADLGDANWLPDLIGTPKQIEWAVQIRAKYLDQFLRWPTELRQYGGVAADLTCEAPAGGWTLAGIGIIADAVEDGMHANAGLMIRCGLRFFTEIRSADWWIENRNCGDLAYEPATGKQPNYRRVMEKYDRLLEAAKAKQLKAEAVAAKREEHRAALVAALGEKASGLTAKLWQGSDGEKRLFVGRGFGANVVTYYHTGNRWHEAGEVEGAKALGEKVEDFKAAAKAIAGYWNAVEIKLGGAA